MKHILLILFFTFFFSTANGQNENQPADQRITSRVDSSNNEELVLIQEFIVNVSLDSVWNAYTTEKGWESWAVPLAEIDWKVGGIIRTTYNINGVIGDSTTIVNHIINYVPHKIITLQAEITDNFPDFMKEEAEDFYNIIYFEKADEGKTTVTSYGIGYKNNEKYLSLMQFFISANKKTYKNLISYLETGEPVKFE
jgi:uncharacterized protein YndB with AHSA1/START domain